MKLELSLYEIGVMGFYQKMNAPTKPIIIISLIRDNVYRFNMGRYIGLVRTSRYICSALDSYRGKRGVF